jgi:hypothetical protein
MIRLALPCMLALAAAACAPVEGDAGTRPVLPWAADPALEVRGGLTVERVRGGPAVAAEEPLRPEPGNVWPAAEGPRATLANPEEALRGIAPMPRGSSSAPPPVMAPAPRLPGAGLPDDAGRLAIAPPAEERRRIETPAGTFTQTTGTARAGAAIGPDGRTAAVTRDAGVTIVTEPGRPAQQVLNPPR